MFPRKSLFVPLIGLVVSLASAPAQEEKPPPATIPEALNVFQKRSQQAAYVRLHAEVSALFVKKDLASAEQKLLEILRIAPTDPIANYNLACVHSLNGKVDEAFDLLKRAIENGMRNPAMFKADKDLTALRDDKRFETLLAKATALAEKKDDPFERQVEKTKVTNGIATVDTTNTAYDFRAGIFRTYFELPERKGPLTPMIAGDQSEVSQLLQKWALLQSAAGNIGDLYDNHDKDHSNMAYRKLPQLTRVEYSEQAKAEGLHNGLQLGFLFNSVTIGNSSTAITGGPFWRSQARMAYSSQRNASLLFAQYRNNHLYVYPEHRDHDPGKGDVFPANTPYVIISQGSSGSDRAFLEALGQTLAAFRPKVKQRLKENGALMPTLQMIFRYANRNVQNDETYLTGQAHPTVFDAKNLAPVKMVNMAHDLKPGDLPPLVSLRTIRENSRSLYLLGLGGEKIFETPSAIARVFREPAHERSIVVSASESRDLDDRPLTFHWKILRGDPSRIQIQPLDDQGKTAEIRVSHHERRPISPGSPLESNRVDIGVFAHNGSHFSAPAFVTFYFLDNEKRVYDEKNRILVMDYLDPVQSKNYVDPAIDPKRDWRDEFRYDAETGRLRGWKRTLKNGDVQEFTPEGFLVVGKDADGTILEARAVRYLRSQTQKNAPPTVSPQYSNETISYPEFLEKKDQAKEKGQPQAQPESTEKEN